ncbi:MAG: hypothetical protein LBE50_07085, partial [Gallionellaceae bacterium]|nr:hypothetical protein [Gallionellaceae bacterium]
RRADDDEISLLDLLIVLAKNKKMILGAVVAAAVIAVAISFLLPKMYTASARMLPPSGQSSSISAMMTAQLGGGLAGMASSALGLKDPNTLYVAMLKSRNITEKLVTRFDLKKVYGQELLEDTLKTLGNQSAISAGKDNVVLVEVTDRDPRRAADLANAYIEELNKLIQTYAVTEAAQRRQFFETQLRAERDKLTDAELVLDRTPMTSLQYLDALRNMKYHESIYEVLVKQFEMAKLDEAKDAPLIQVLDQAAVPERKSKPKRALIVILVVMMAFVLAVIWAFVKEALARQASNPEQAGRMQELCRLLRWRG